MAGQWKWEEGELATDNGMREPSGLGEVRVCGALAWWFTRERGGGERFWEPANFDIDVFKPLFTLWPSKVAPYEGWNNIEKPPSLSPGKEPVLSSLAQECKFLKFLHQQAMSSVCTTEPKYA